MPDRIAVSGELGAAIVFWIGRIRARAGIAGICDFNDAASISDPPGNEDVIGKRSYLRVRPFTSFVSGAGVP